MARSDDGFQDLIEALTIFRKYAPQTANPTHCEHDTLMVCAPKDVSPGDEARLDELGFHWSDSYGSWVSFRFGSA